MIVNLFCIFIPIFGFEKIADNSIISRLTGGLARAGGGEGSCNVILPDVELPEQMWTCDNQDTKNNGKNWQGKIYMIK